MEGQPRRPFFITLLSVQYGLAGLGNLAGILYLASAAISAGSAGLYVALNTLYLWVPMLLIGAFLFVSARGLYDMKSYGWKLVVIGSSLWLLVSLVTFLGAVILVDPVVQVGQPPDIRPMVQQMFTGIPPEALGPGTEEMIVEGLQGAVSIGFFGLISIYYLIKGFFLFNAIYNGIVIAYLVKVRHLFLRPAAVQQERREVQQPPPPQSG